MEFPELNKVLATAGEGLAKEINFLMALAASHIKKVIGKITRFDQKIVVPARTTINLIEFYQEGRDDIKLSIASNFEYILKEVTDNGKYAIVDIGGEIISQYINETCTNDFNTKKDMQEPFLVMQDDAGRAEIRKRLAITAYCMQQQPDGEEGFLQSNNGNVTVVGYPLIESGPGWNMYVYRHGGLWDCGADGNLNGWKEGTFFWSRNEPAQAKSK